MKKKNTVTRISIMHDTNNPFHQPQSIQDMKTNNPYKGRIFFPRKSYRTKYFEVAKDASQTERISVMKTVMHRTGAFAIVLLIANLFLVSAGFAQTTRTWQPTVGGLWTTAANWSPSGQPVAGDDVTIDKDQSAAITGLPDISLRNLTISGICNLQSNAASASYRTLTVTGSLSVTAGKTLTCGQTNIGRLDFTLSSTATGNIAGTVYMNSYSSSGYDRTFANNGNLTITSAGLITGQNTALFDLNSGATLQIENTLGITTTGTNGAVTVPGTRAYSSGANYIYNGTSSQVTGNGLTQNTPANLTINNSAGVTLSAATIISGLLTMTSGTLNMADLALTVGSLTGSGNLTNSTGSTTARTITIGSDNTSPAAYTGVISNGINSGGVSLTKTGTGTLTLSGDNSYTGLTTISAGIIKLGAGGGATNTPLGTTGAGTTVSATGAALDLNGFTLGTTELLNLNGTGVSSGGALTNSSATPVSYSGNIVLQSASSVVADNGAITLQTGTLTGAFGLTLGGSTGGTVSRVIGT
ncbi:MAG: autotransporter-associated beta strand repeat-containing protein, partial [Bacteroidia bacterium]|nr:autotransporter-associated beta strand repeat-containing protein [Bacteroidia bacterium]